MARNNQSNEERQADAEASLAQTAAVESGNAEPVSFTQEEIREQTEKDVEVLTEVLTDVPANAPLYGSYQGQEVDFEVLKEDPNEAIKDQNPAKKIDGSELVEDDEVERHMFGTIPASDGVVSEQSMHLLGRGPIPPVEYGFDKAENTNIDPIETDGLLDLKDKNRREAGVIDPTLNADARQIKYPMRTLTARKAAQG